jgi:hypothetical protein
MNKKEKEYMNYITQLEKLQSLTVELDAYDPSDFPDADWKGLAKDIQSANDRINLLINSMVEE